MILISRYHVAQTLDRTPSAISIISKRHNLGRRIGRESFYTLEEYEAIKKIIETKLQRLIREAVEVLKTHQPMTFVQLGQALDEEYHTIVWVVTEWTFRDHRLYEHDDGRLGYILGDEPLPSFIEQYFIKVKEEGNAKD